MAEQQHDYTLIFIDVSQGDATLIFQASVKHSVLVDIARFGPVMPFLEQDNLLQAVFLTHWDKDHIGGLPALINWLHEKQQQNVKLFLKREIAPSKLAKRVRRVIVAAIKEKVLEAFYAYSDFPYSNGQGLIKMLGGRFLILWPPHSNIIASESRNPDSLILLFEVNAFRLLSGGDASGSVWPLIASEDLKAKVLKYPHHGGELKQTSESWNADDLISHVEPEFIVVSVGKNNRYGHPSEEILQAEKKTL